MQVAFQVPAGNAQTRAQIGRGSDPLIQLQGRNHFIPVRLHRRAEVSKRIRIRHGPDEIKINGGLRQFSAFITHRKDRALEHLEASLEHLPEGLTRIGTSNNEAFRLEGSLDRPTKDERFDQVVQRE